MKHLKRIAMGLAFLALILLAISFVLPSRINVARAVEINAGESQIYPYIANLRKFSQWSPWAKIDPNAKYSYSGPQIGAGARLAWQSDNPNVGAGVMKIIDAKAPNSLDLALDFDDGGTGTSQFRLEPIRAGTRVTWRFQTDLGANPIMRWMGLLLEQVIGETYDEGLQNLKALVESGKR